MKKYRELNKILGEITDVKADKIVNDNVESHEITFLRLRELLMQKGNIERELEDPQVYIVTIKGGFAKLNRATVAVKLEEGVVLIAAYADEGLINQHTSEGIVNELKETIRQNKK